MIKLKKITTKRKKLRVRANSDLQFLFLSGNDASFPLFKPFFMATCHLLPKIEQNNEGLAKYLPQAAVGLAGAGISAYVIGRKDVAFEILLATFFTIGVEMLIDVINQKG